MQDIIQKNELNLEGKLILSTNRLELRKFTLGDCDFIIKLLNTPGWIKYIGNRRISSKEEAEKYIRDILIDSYEKNGYGLWAMAQKSNDSVIGMCGLVKRDTLEDTDIGFAVLPEFERKGFAFEAANAVLDFAINSIKLTRISAITVPENAASIRLLEKLGMKFSKKIIHGDKQEELLYYIYP